ncbi:MAG: menaquinone biosynthesis decarboxylase [Prevotellaceae bacterium]|jgi:4-hydroxy-3-polyprenylbenzoate decarboxylase|nr:menaquinone biosynthesis decarboxylase [Prevotellaceae bacterium]
MFKSLSAYIDLLEQQGELIRFSEFVDPVLEMAEITDRVSKSKDGGKALLFENTGTNFPVLTNMMGSHRRMCSTLGVENYDDVGKKIDNFFAQLVQPKLNLWDKLKMLGTLKQASTWMPRVQRGRGKCQQVVTQHPSLDILPVLKSWPCDGGRFVTLPMVHTRDLRTGVRNVGMYRMQVFDDKTTGMHWHKHKTGARHFAQYKEAGQRMPVAVALGGDPVYAYCATAPLPDNLDEYLLAGFLRSKPVTLVKCITQPLEVPADADIVIEGYVDPQEQLVVEGPFGDHTGFYSLEDYYPKFHVTCITHRKNAVYPATVVGVPPQEDAYISKASERIFLAPIRLVMSPEMVDMSMPAEGVAHNIVVVKINKTYEGQAHKVANTLWGAGQMMLNKMLVVVDGDVDVHNAQRILDALTKNFIPDRDVYFGKGPLDVLDHAAQACGYGGKICLDATVKMPGEMANKDSTFSPENLYTFAHDVADVRSKIAVQFDKSVDLADLSACLWLLGNNVDPQRDCRVEDGRLYINATTKKAGEKGFNRRWPNVVCSADKTIDSVDKKWSKLGLGEIVNSPSRKFSRLKNGDGAATG